MRGSDQNRPKRSLALRTLRLVGVLVIEGPEKQRSNAARSTAFTRPANLQVMALRAVHPVDGAVDLQKSAPELLGLIKPQIGFYPKRWEDREVPVPKDLIDRLKKHPHYLNSKFVFPSPRGNRELHLLDKCKAIADRAGLDTKRFDLKTFRSTYATRMLRAGFDPRTVQHWMGHKSLETTMRYLSPARDVHDRLNKVQIAGILNVAS